MEMPQTTICGAGIESIRRKIRWNFENVSCGHECRPRASGEHHVLDEHSEIEPASDLKPPVDGHDQADPRAKKCVILRGLVQTRRSVRLLDSE